MQHLSWFVIDIMFINQIMEDKLMIRKIIKIDEEKCNGCGACANACHEGAIDMIDGKARLTRENYCDGLGDCLPACPTGAITFEMREAPAYDEAAVLKSKERKSKTLINWPVQIKLLPTKAPYFDGADILIAADCTAYAYARFHEDFAKDKVVLIGCPKLDGVDYFEKLYHIIKDNDVKSVTVLRMEVPCCGGIEEQQRRHLRKVENICHHRWLQYLLRGRFCNYQLPIK